MRACLTCCHLGLPVTLASALMMLLESLGKSLTSMLAVNVSDAIVDMLLITQAGAKVKKDNGAMKTNLARSSVFTR